jgi:shikimate dehydrogenase
MIHLGLTGYPLGHSLSPKLHTASLRYCKLDGDYSLFPIRPDDLQALKDLLARVYAKEIHGLNVTIPHKQNVIQFLDELTPTAKAIGAVSTIYVKENKLIGDNADAPGFLADLNGFLGGENMNLKEKGESALVLGAGGSARAIIYALLNDGWKVTVAARRIEQADELARSFPKINVIEYNVQTFELADLQLIVNTTPVGMTPNIDQSPWPENLSFPSNATIYDLVYNPRETKLVKDARAAGLSATTGLGMLIEQAMIGFEIWTGKQIPREIMSSAVEEV